MKKGIHPDYHPVVFRDARVMDTAGRVEKFHRRYGTPQRQPTAQEESR